MKAALLGGNRFRGDVLRNLKAAILNEEVSLMKRDEGLSDEEVEKVIAREVKKRADSATQYEAAGRPELSEAERKESAVIEAYLPAQVSEDEINIAIKQAMSDLGVTSMAGMGQVIGAVKQKFGTSADGALVAQLVKTALQ